MKLNRKKLGTASHGDYIEKKTHFDVYMRKPRLRSIRRGFTDFVTAMLWAGTYKTKHPNADVVIVRKHTEAFVMTVGHASR